MKRIILLSIVLILTGISAISRAQSYRPLYNQGTAFFAVQQYDSAMVRFSAAIKADRRQAPAYLGRAKCYLELKRYDNAIVDCSLSLSINPNYGEAYYIRGMARKAKGSQPSNFCDDFFKAKQNGYKVAKQMIKDFCKEQL